MFNVQGVISTVDWLLEDKSITKTVTYRAVSSSYSKATMKTTETPTDVPTRALVSEYSDNEIERPGSTVRASDRKFTIRASALSSVTPSVKDRIYFEGRWWEIVGMKLVKALGTAISYAFQGR